MSLNILLIMLMSIMFVSGLNEQRLENDDMCKITSDVLCIRDVLMIIATISKSINRTVNEIEKYIIEKVQIHDTLNRYVDFEMSLIHSHLPTSEYHDKFFQLNNIDKKYLSHLFLEAHYAMSFYYNSINDVLNMNNLFAFTSDSLFKQIQYNLRNEVICRYRSVLNVYSHEWPSMDEVKGIQFSRRKYRSSPSFVHDVHSIIIARLLREWMQRIDNVIINLEAKYF